MKQINAYGKVILFGEHAVVYGHPALALGVPDGMVLHSFARTPARMRVRVQDWDLDVDDTSDMPVGEALRRLSRAMPGEGGCDAVVRSSIPMGAGLGSSAAMAVVLVRALAAARGRDMGQDEIRAMAHLLEHVFHGHPSGIDDAVATYGGLCLFRKEGWDVRSRANRTYRFIARDVVKVPYSLPPLVIGDTGVGRSTAKMVGLVRQQREEDPERVDAGFVEIESCLQKGLDAIESCDRSGLGKAMLRNQKVLADLGLSCPDIERMISLALGAGAYGAKLTGAGGGGCVVTLAPGREKAVIEAWACAGYRGWSVGPARASERIAEVA